MVLALFFPTSGLMRGLNAITRNFSSSIIRNWVSIGRWQRDETSLDKACKAGALCVVVRNANWRPTPGRTGIAAVVTGVVEETCDVDTTYDTAQLIENYPELANAARKVNIPARLQSIETVLAIYRPTWLRETQSIWWTHFDTSWGRNIVDPATRAIHGSYKLPNEYSFSILPRDTMIQATAEDDPLEGEIAASYSVVKVLASMFQLLAATYTLWLHRGNQVNDWGFASFSFMPVPYAIMSLVNGISHIFTPEYPALYMVRSSAMEEAKIAGGSFSGTVAQVLEPADPSDNDSGYVSNFDSGWTGVTLGSLRRIVVSFMKGDSGRQQQFRPLSVVSVGKYRPDSEAESTQTDIEHGNSEADPTQTDIEHGNALLLPGSLEEAQLSFLLVEQSSRSRGELYEIRPGVQAAVDGMAESRTDEGSTSSIRTTKRLWITRLKTRVQTFWAYIWPAADDAASITAVRGGLRRQLRTLASLVEAIELRDRLRDRLREDRLARISFRACEQFKRHDESPSAPATSLEIWGFITQISIAAFISSLSLLVIGSMSGFKAGSSSRVEQTIYMMWLALGIVIGFLVPFLDIKDANTLLIKLPLKIIQLLNTRISVLVSYFSPYFIYWAYAAACLPWSIFIVPIWGFVIVGQQLNE